MTGLRPEYLGHAESATLTIGSVDDAWQLCLEIAARRRRGIAPEAGTHLQSARLAIQAGATCDTGRCWRLNGEWTDEALQLFELYAPLLALRPGERHACAHLGQSIDGRIATAGGHSFGLSGEPNLMHLHRLRALSDAIVIGSGTALADNPQLTTRLVNGPNPVRVVLDGSGRIPPGLRLCSDGEAPTLVLGPRGGAATHAQAQQVGLARRLTVDSESRLLRPSAILDALEGEGLAVVFIEGGGTTVSRFLESDCLERLQITVTPVLLGSGRPALTLPPIERISEGIRPPVRRFALGEDLLWDFALRG